MKQKWWGQNRVNNCLICHWDLLMGRIRMLRADLWTTKLLLLWAASLGVYYSSAKRSRSKMKTKGDPWTRGCTRWVYCDDTGLDAGEAGFQLLRTENELIKKRVLFHLIINQPIIDHRLPAAIREAQQSPSEGPGGRSHFKELFFSSNPRRAVLLRFPIRDSATTNHKPKSTGDWQGNEKMWLQAGFVL